MTKGIVFVGQSLLNHDHKLAETKVDLSPPIRRGDLPAVLDEGYETIGIVDGNFWQDVAVSPKEIWQALKSGATVLGGGSIGALRAVELRPYGMIGVGAVYGWFLSGRLNRDDDVAVRYVVTEKGYKTLSVPMVSVTWVVDRAIRFGLISEDTSSRLIDYARRIDWRERTWEAIWSDSEVGRELNDEFRDLALDPEGDIKRLDALQVVERAVNVSVTRFRSEAGRGPLPISV